MKTLIHNISELVTLGPLVRDHRFTSIQFEDLGILQDAWLLIEDGFVLARGNSPLPELRDTVVIDAQNSLVMPGLIDSHTHPVFAGSRSHEFCKRLEGKSYEQIAREGGGIAHSVLETRKETLENLGTSAAKHLKAMLSYGVTTVEAKSGYGLTVESELLQLRALKYAKQLTPQRIIATCLALHALPKEAASGMDFATEMAKLLLPQVAKEQLATFVDAFVEKDYFTAEEAQIWFLEAKKLGFGVKLHADEFTDSKGADLAAALDATSADHLQFASDEGLRHMARSKVVATLLPGTSLYTGIPFTNGRKIADLGCAVAIASDFNPGSSPFVNLPFLAAMAGVHGKLKPAEIIAGVTFVAAKSLGIESLVGSLEPGYHGDFFIHPSRSVKEWIADMGKTQPSSVFIDGIEALL
jgi:imidazolonepropionase